MEYTSDYLQSLIRDKAEESGMLEYKAGAALSKKDESKREMTKDIAGFANAGGGVLIYGIRESQDAGKRHFPASLDPINQSEISKEWVEHIVGQIQPRIENLKIFPIHVGPKESDYCYLLEIPQSNTAHQSLDGRYYRRRNFEVSMMVDYEIRDVMNRRRHPRIVAEVRFVRDRLQNVTHFSVRFRNVSRIMARHYAAVVHMPVRDSKGRCIFAADASLDTKEDLTFWTFSVGNGIGAPLFPGSSSTVRHEVKYVVKFEPPLGATLRDIELTLFADDMEKVFVSKELARADREWV